MPSTPHTMPSAADTVHATTAASVAVLCTALKEATASKNTALITKIEAKIRDLEAPSLPTPDTTIEAHMPVPQKIRNNDIEKFLKGANLGQYVSDFIDHGYDDLNFLRSAVDIDKLGLQLKMKVGHIEKLKWILRQGSVTSDGSDTQTITSTASGMDDTRTLVTCVIDRSGSMNSMIDDVLGGFNSFIDKQKATCSDDGGDIFVSVTRFSNTVEVLHNAVPIDTIPMATLDTFRPCGATALYDAVGQAIEDAKVKSKIIGAGNVTVVILTDGHENRSKRYTQDDIFQEIKTLEEKGYGGSDWSFVFLAANQDAMKTGSRMGMKRSNCMTYSATPRGMVKGFDAMSYNLSAQRRCSKLSGKKKKFKAFSPEQRRDCK